ncbi:hypothetical protein PGT21_022569 [Puccinia graminis f. sp. tritici]|uniref:Uncharacterized protein n=1 Tax=Puccinia graminis f. sp. tritici TaxID=56615 RepID=A0A5B0P0G1_PUCGR|nr:hypothetical protein PGT21_022569 [Puccinia graminis f. sp. tritici]
MLLISGRAQIAKEYIIELRTPSKLMCRTRKLYPSEPKIPAFSSLDKSAQEEDDEVNRYPPSTLQNLYGLKFRHLNFIGTAGPH